MSLPTWQLLWIIPLLNSIIFALIITPETLIKTSVNPSVLYFLPPVWITLTFTTIFLLPRVIIAATQNIDLQRTLQLSEIQVRSQQKQNELLQLHIEETRRLRHDIRHHFRMLESLTRSQDMDGIKKYLSETLSSLPEQAPAIHCSNSAVNAFLCYFKELAVQQDIDMSLSISVPEKLPFPDTDLCIILGNLLENAVEACQNMKSDKRYIHVKMLTPSPQTMVIIIENSYEGSIRLAADGSFLSSKEAGRHGIGISSVLSITEKYNGIPRFEYGRNNIFKVSLLLNGTKNVP